MTVTSVLRRGSSVRLRHTGSARYLAVRARVLERLAQARAALAIEEETEENDVAAGVMMLPASVGGNKDMGAVLAGALDVCPVLFHFPLLN